MMRWSTIFNLLALSSGGVAVVLAIVGDIEGAVIYLAVGITFRGLAKIDERYERNRR